MPLLRLRSGSFALAFAAIALTACGPNPFRQAETGGTTNTVAPGQPVELATFVGMVDETGKMTIQTFPSVAGGDPSALTAFQPTQDGQPGTGPANTFELVTENTSGYGAGSACTPAAWGGNVTLRSFYTTQTFWDVHVELTAVTSGYEGCNSAAAYADLSRVAGLWRYGTIGYAGGPVPNAVTALWAFRYVTPGSFSFTGRIMGIPGPLFDWQPSLVTTPVRQFQEVKTTTGHFVWNGTTFEDRLGLGITFTATGGTAHGDAIDLTGTLDPYATFSTTRGDAVFVAPAALAQRIDTSGEFTVCARFKPGRHPNWDNGDHPTKVLVSKGLPETYGVGAVSGWSLMQMHKAYCFHYGVAGTADVNLMSDYFGDELASPETWAFDYVCGGRNTSATDVNRRGLTVGAHGVTLGNVYQNISSTIGADDASLPLVIGGYLDNGTVTNRLADGGVYEIIFDSRPVTIDVMNDIVARAEGRTLTNGIGTSGSGAGANGWAPTTQTIVGDSSTTRQVPGVTGGPYTLAPYMTVPLLVDGNGNLQPSQSVVYSRPFTEDSTTTGYCVVADVTANAGWWDSGAGAPLVVDGIVQFGGNGLASGTLSFWNPWGFNFQVPGVTGIFGVSFGAWSGWAPASTHVFAACVDANNASDPHAHLYVDDLVTYAASTAINFNGSQGGGTPFNVGDPLAGVGIANGVPNGNAFTPLSGGRVHRVRFCPNSNPLLCR